MSQAVQICLPSLPTETSTCNQSFESWQSFQLLNRPQTIGKPAHWPDARFRVSYLFRPGYASHAFRPPILRRLITFGGGTICGQERMTCMLRISANKADRIWL